MNLSIDFYYLKTTQKTSLSIDDEKNEYKKFYSFIFFNKSRARIFRDNFSQFLYLSYSAIIFIKK